MGWTPSTRHINHARRSVAEGMRFGTSLPGAAGNSSGTAASGEPSTACRWDMDPVIRSAADTYLMHCETPRQQAAPPLGHCGKTNGTVDAVAAAGMAGHGRDALTAFGLFSPADSGVLPLREPQ